MQFNEYLSNHEILSEYFIIQRKILNKTNEIFPKHLKKKQTQLYSK